MRLNTIHYVLAILCCNLISCQTNVKLQADIKKTNQITLIFKSTPPPWKVHHEGYNEGAYTMGYEAISYVDDNFIHQRFVPDTLKNDTLKVKTNRKWVEFIHTYNVYDKLSYIFQNGDSVLFSYRGKDPIASVLNRKTKVNDVNFDLNKKETLYPNNYSSFTKLQSLFNFLRHPNIEAEITFEKYLQDFNNEKYYLDSLKKNNLISDTIYNFYNIRSIYQYKTFQLKCYLGYNTLKKNNLRNRILTKEDLNIHMSDRELGQIDYGNILEPRNDSLMYFGFFNDVISLISSNLGKRVGFISSTHYVNGVADAGGMHPDYLALYDTISKANLLSPLAINLWKFQTIQRIIENNTIDEAEKAFVRFKNEVKDSALINYVIEKYSLVENIAGDANDDLLLVNNLAEHLTFNQLIGKHKGKVIYIDFWATWCPPCIKEFEYSEKLKNDYKGKDFVQIFISSEQNKERWSNASKRYHLDPESYFVENRFTSRQLEKMNIKFVPHYILFGKNGTQINVTRPSDKGIRKLIDRYLNE